MSKAEEQEMRRAQAWFAEAVKLTMEGKSADLSQKIDEYLAKNNRITGQDIITEFKSEGKTLIHLAASSGYSEVVTMLISKVPVKSAIANLADDRGFTPLINATVSESVPSMTAFLEIGANVNSETKEGATALHFAAGDGSLERMGMLLDAGARINVMSNSGTPLHWAAGKGNAHAIKFLVERGAEIERTEIKSKGKNGHVVTPAVIMAAVGSSDDGVCTLLGAGSYSGHVITGNLTLLHICAENKLENSVKQLVGTGIGQKCAHVRSTYNNVPIELAAMHGAGSRGIVEALVPHSPPVDEATSNTVESILAAGPALLRKWEQQHEKNKKEIEAVDAKVFDIKGGDVHECEPIEPARDEAAEKASAAKKAEGNAAFKEGKFDIALAAYTEAIELQGDNAALWSNRSATYLALNQPRDALVDAEVCRGLNPKWEKACLRLAKARIALGMFEDAAVAAFEGLKLDNSNKALKALTNEAVRLGKEAHQKELSRRKEANAARKKEALAGDNAVECNYCDGSGFSNNVDCTSCNGQGYKVV